GERAEPAYGIGRKRKCTLELDHIGVAREQGYAAEHLLKQTRLSHQRQRRHGVLGDEELERLHAHALARQLLEAVARLDTGREPFRVGSALAVGGVETEESQDTQIVLGHARCGIANEANAPRLDVGEAA